MYVTRNTEYHVRDGVCIAVRDRQSGVWIDAHDALRQPVVGCVSMHRNGEVVPSRSAPQPGDALFFETTGRELLTSALCAIERPTKDVVEAYPTR
jgi:hypothetical protein